MNISAFNRLFRAQIKVFLLIPYLILALVIEVHASNTTSEQHWAEQLRKNIVIGEPLELPMAGSESTFFAIFTAHTTAMPKGAIILMHGTGAHPDWSDVIHSLRVKLPDKGWATLSIQLPLTFPDKKEVESRKQIIEASIPRIDAAISFLKSKSYTPIVLTSHGFGSLMALNFLQMKMSSATLSEQPPMLHGAILISTPSPGTEIPLNSPAMIEKVKIPLLDLYGSKDLDSVLRSAKARKNAALKAGNQHYRQVKTIGANHFYNGLNDELFTYVSGWLKRNISDTRQK